MEVTFHSFSKLKRMSRWEAGIREAVPGIGTGRSQGLGAEQRPLCAKPWEPRSKDGGPQSIKPAWVGLSAPPSPTRHPRARPDPVSGLHEIGWAPVGAERNGFNDVLSPASGAAEGGCVACRRVFL